MKVRTGVSKWEWTSPDISETRFGQTLVKQMKTRYGKSIVFHKHSSRYSSGVADWECAFDGHVNWMELKVVSMPKKSTTPVGLIGNQAGQVKHLQMKFLRDRNRVGINGFVVFLITANLAVVMKPEHMEYWDENTEQYKAVRYTAQDMWELVNFERVRGSKTGAGAWSPWDLTPFLRQTGVADETREKELFNLIEMHKRAFCDTQTGQG